MSHTRRDFLHLALAAGSAGALASSALAAPALARVHRASAPLHVLILGGTGFIGPHCVDALRARGHKVTIFNRGRTEKRTGHVYSGTDVEVLRGNRDPEKHAEETPGPDGKPVQVETSPKGLSQLEGRKFDAVIDTSGYYPRIVKASASLLAPNVGQYVFISSVSVYKDNATPNADTTAEVGTIPDPTVETMGAQFENYGPLKALCEQAAEAALPGRATNIRPGLIVGPLDPTGRFTYWPVRCDKGGDVLAPGSPDDPIQLIDARDLAEWIVHCIETRTMGVFDAIGPQGGSKWGDVLAACAACASTKPNLVWVPAAFCSEHEVSPWGDLPLWVPPEGEMAGFHRRNVEKSFKAGLKQRPLADTCKSTLEWYKSLPADSPLAKLAALKPEKETAVLDAWKAKQSAGG